MTRSPSPLPATLVRRVRPKTYTVAVYLVGTIVALEVGMLISVFWLRAMVVSVNVHLPKPSSTEGAPTIMPAPAPTPAPAKSPEIARLPSLSTTTSQAGRLSVPGVSDKLQQINDLNDQAQARLRQNDLKGAAQLLNTAEDLDPRNPTTLKSLADTYYLMNDSVDAKIYWERIADLGPGVGTVYALAKDHVLLLNSTSEASPLSESSPYPRTTYIDQVEKTPIETTSGQPRFHLRATLMRKDNRSPFDQKKLQVYVIFYQQFPDDRLAPDLTQHKGSFENTFLFWNGKIREPFSVDYLMPAPSPGQTPAEYYGFVIGIYYNKILQDVRSEPSDLAHRIPLPQAIE